MGGRFRIFAPTAVLVMIFAYLCWPYLSEPVEKVDENRKLPEIAAALLHPALGDPADRDPFGGSVAFHYDESATEKPGAGGRGKVAVQKPSDPHAKTAQAGGKIALEATRPNPIAKAKQQSNALAGLVLTATYIQGNRSFALINGRVYSKGDSLDLAGVDPGVVLVEEVHRHKVVLGCGGKKIELGYADASKKLAKAQPAHGANQSPGKRTAQPVKATNSRKGPAKAAPAVKSNPPKDQGATT